MYVELIALIAIVAFIAVAAWSGSLQGPPDSPDEQAGTFSRFMSTRYFSGLDALRAASVIAVVWAHVSGPHAVTLLNRGHKGVDLFFAISGFLVTTILLREHRRNHRISLADFYIRRSLRIFPLYYAVLALYCVLVLLTMAGTPKATEFWGNLPAFLTYTSNWFVTLEGAAEQGVTFYFSWSLATEEQFYMFWPALMVLVIWLTRRKWAPAVAAVLLICIQIVAAGLPQDAFILMIIAHLAPAILFGVMFAVLLNDRRVFGLLYPVLGHPAAAPLALAGMLAFLQLDSISLMTRFFMALLVACVCIREDTLLHPVLRWKPAAWVGTISYGIYLMHMLAANVVRRLLDAHSGLLVFGLTTALVIGMAYVSFRYFETPLLKLKSRFQGRPREAGSEVAAAGHS